METQNESWFWRSYIKIGSSLAKCNLCNKVYEAKDDRLSMKAKLHLLKEHKVLYINRAISHNCWIYYNLLTGYRAVCNICGKICDTIESRCRKKYFNKIHLSIIRQQFWVRKSNTLSGQMANCKFCGASYLFTYAFTWTERRLIKLYTKKIIFY